jgi:competence ComEA-like helix-hairpin-helix protein
VIVSEAGASVYSASELAAREFPDLDVSLRGAVSIARRLQDPLAELVKIEPKSIGVGQYQHDVDQHRLGRSLEAVVEDAVNAVGVDLNTASAPLLARVSGVGPGLAEAIVAHRDANGPFVTRRELLKVARLGPKAPLNRRRVFCASPAARNRWTQVPSTPRPMMWRAGSWPPAGATSVPDGRCRNLQKLDPRAVHR